MRECRNQVIEDALLFFIESRFQYHGVQTPKNLDVRGSGGIGRRAGFRFQYPRM